MLLLSSGVWIYIKCIKFYCIKYVCSFNCHTFKAEIKERTCMYLSSLGCGLHFFYFFFFFFCTTIFPIASLLSEFILVKLDIAEVAKKLCNGKMSFSVAPKTMKLCIFFSFRIFMHAWHQTSGYQDFSFSPLFFPSSFRCIRLQVSSACFFPCSWWSEWQKIYIKRWKQNAKHKNDFLVFALYILWFGVIFLR